MTFLKEDIYAELPHSFWIIPL